MGLLNAVKNFCAYYLFNQWPEFDQTSTDTALGRGKWQIRQGYEVIA